MTLSKIIIIQYLTWHLHTVFSSLQKGIIKHETERKQRQYSGIEQPESTLDKTGALLKQGARNIITAPLVTSLVNTPGTPRRGRAWSKCEKLHSRFSSSSVPFPPHPARLFWVSKWGDDSAGDRGGVGGVLPWFFMVRVMVLVMIFWCYKAVLLLVLVAMVFRGASWGCWYCWW